MKELTRKFNSTPTREAPMISSKLPLMNPRITNISSKENINPNIKFQNEALQNNFRLKPSHIDKLENSIQRDHPIPGFDRKVLRLQSKSRERLQAQQMANTANLTISGHSFTDSMLTNSKLHSNKKLKELIERNKSVVEEQYKVAETAIQEVSEQMSKAIQNSDKIYKKAMGDEVSFVDSNSFNNLIDKDSFSQKNFCDSNFTVEGRKVVKSGGKVLKKPSADFKHLNNSDHDLVKNITFSDNCSYKRDCPTIEEETVDKSLNFSAGINLTVVQDEGEILGKEEESLIQADEGFFAKKDHLESCGVAIEKDLVSKLTSSQKRLMTSSLKSDKKRKERDVSLDKRSEGFQEGVKDALMSNFESESELGKTLDMEFDLVAGKSKRYSKDEDFILMKGKDNRYISFKNSVKTESRKKSSHRQSSALKQTLTKKSRKSSVKKFLNSLDDELNLVNSKISNIVNLIEKQEASSAKKRGGLFNKKRLTSGKKDHYQHLSDARRLFYEKSDEYKATVISKRYFLEDREDNVKTQKKLKGFKKDYRTISKSPIQRKNKNRGVSRSRSRHRKTRDFTPEHLRTHRRSQKKKKRSPTPSKSQPPRKPKRRVSQFKRTERIYKASFFLKEVKTNAWKLGEQLRQERELKKCTFKPAINKHDKYYSKVARIPFDQRQKCWLEKREMKKMDKRKNLKDMKNEDCTFKPEFKSRGGSLSPNFFDYSKGT